MEAAEKDEIAKLKQRVGALEILIDELLGQQMARDPLFAHAIDEHEVRQQFPKLAAAEDRDVIKRHMIGIHEFLMGRIAAGRARMIFFH